MEKPSILLLHGALGSKTQLEALQSLLTTNFTVHLLNFEGHGGRTSEREFSMDTFAENIVEKLRSEGIKKTHIFGYSMGGYVALTLAKKYPTLVDRIVTLGTKFDWTIETAEKEVKMLNPIVIEAKVPAYAKSLQELHHPNDWKIVLQKTARMMLSLANGEKLANEDFIQIQHNVLIGIGTLDRMVTIQESEHVAALLPKGTLKIIPDVKHPIDKVDQKVLATLITGFISS